MRRTAAWGFFVVALLWAAVIVAAPRLLVSAAGPGVDVAAVVYVAGGFVCHQRPERSFLLGSRAFPVCGRCTGLYLGAPIGMAIVLFRARRAAGRTDRWWRGLLGVAAVPTILSLVLEWTTGWSGNASRALMAVPLGAAAGAFVAAALLGRLSVPGLLHYPSSASSG